MKLPRDLTGAELAKALGTLSAILGDVAERLKMDREELLRQVFG
jgi:hypothetical protein